MSALVSFSTPGSRNSDQKFRGPLLLQPDRHARNRLFDQHIPVAGRAQLLRERLQLDREPRPIVFGHRAVEDRESGAHTADSNPMLMYAFRIIALVGEIGAAQHVSNGRLGNRGKANAIAWQIDEGPGNAAELRKLGAPATLAKSIAEAINESRGYSSRRA